MSPVALSKLGRLRCGKARHGRIGPEEPFSKVNLVLNLNYTNTLSSCVVKSNMSKQVTRRISVKGTPCVRAGPQHPCYNSRYDQSLVTQSEQSTSSRGGIDSDSHLTAMYQGRRITRSPHSHTRFFVFILAGSTQSRCFSFWCVYPRTCVWRTKSPPPCEFVGPSTCRGLTPYLDEYAWIVIMCRRVVRAISTDRQPDRAVYFDPRCLPDVNTLKQDSGMINTKTEVAPHCHDARTAMGVSVLCSCHNSGCAGPSGMFRKLVASTISESC
jgi:hypothetical protein